MKVTLDWTPTEGYDDNELHKKVVLVVPNNVILCTFYSIHTIRQQASKGQTTQQSAVQWLCACLDERRVAAFAVDVGDGRSVFDKRHEFKQRGGMLSYFRTL